jgi:hypothetical protein
MKNVILAALVILCAGAAASAQTVDPVKYFEFLNNEHVAIVSKSLEYVQHSVHSDDASGVERKRVELINQIGVATANVNNRPSDKATAQLKADMLSVLNAYKEAFRNEFSTLLQLKMESDNSFEAMQKYLDAQDAVEKKLAAAADRFLQAQKEFAKKNNILLVESDRNSEINQINRLNNYHRAVFLRYFRLSKRNAAVLDAMSKQDVKLMEKERVLLLEESKRELKSLQLMPAFNGDTEFRDAVVNLASFFKDMAENDFAKVVAALRKKEMTQEDVDAYNKAVDRFNNESGVLLDNYNQTSDKLFKKNVPKPAIETKQI